MIKKVIQGIIIGFVAGSLIFIAADMIYAFYVASHVLPNVAEWERNKTLCGSPVFRSSFAIVVIYFLLIFIFDVVGVVAFAWFIFKYVRQIPCIKSLRFGNVPNQS